MQASLCTKYFQKNPAVGSFYKTESKIWASLDQLGSFRVLEFMIFFVIFMIILRI